MATLALSAHELVSRVEARMGWESPTAEKNAWALARVNDALARLVVGEIPGTNPPEFHDWLFLRPYSTLTVWPTITTAAVTTAGASDTHLTTAAATFYATMVGHTITSDTLETSYTITAYTSTTDITVDADASADDGDTFTITADGRYALPTNFGGLSEQPVYAYVSGANFGDIDQASLRHIYRLLRDDATTDDPTDFSLEAKAEAVAATQAWWLRAFPIPDTARTVIVPYRIEPTAMTDSSSVYPPGAVEHTRTILQLAYAECEREKTHKSGPEELRAQNMMLASIRLDKGVYSNAAHIEQMTDVDTGLRVT